jgi:hypothetical protein
MQFVTKTFEVEVRHSILFGRMVTFSENLNLLWLEKVTILGTMHFTMSFLTYGRGKKGPFLGTGWTYGSTG